MKFKVGDRVRITCAFPWNVEKYGKEYIVTKFDMNPQGGLLVQNEEYSYHHTYVELVETESQALIKKWMK